MQFASAPFSTDLTKLETSQSNETCGIASSEPQLHDSKKKIRFAYRGVIFLPAKVWRLVSRSRTNKFTHYLNFLVFSSSLDRFYGRQLIPQVANNLLRGDFNSFRRYNISQRNEYTLEFFFSTWFFNSQSILQGTTYIWSGEQPTTRPIKRLFNRERSKSITERFFLNL